MKKVGPLINRNSLGVAKGSLFLRRELRKTEGSRLEKQRGRVFILERFTEPLNAQQGQLTQTPNIVRLSLAVQLESTGFIEISVS